MAPVSQTGMEKAEMKQLLNKATKDKPVSCSFGLGKEPAFAMLMMHRTKNPKAVDKEMSEAFPDTKNNRWGTVFVEEANPTLAKFVINKPVSGMAKRLVKTLKGTSYNKVEILLEDGTLVEGAFDEEEDGVAAAEGEAAAAPPGAPPAPPPPPAASGPTPEQKAQLAAELEAKLKIQIMRIGPAAAAQPAMLDQLKKFATDANVNIKTGNFVYAGTAITQLTTALDKISGPGVPPAPPGPPPAPGKPAFNAAELEAKLRGLIARIGPAAAAQPAMLDQLKKFATDANVNIKTNNLTYANVAITQLAAALDKIAPAAPGSGAAAGAPAPGTPTAGVPADLEKMRNTLANMQLAIVKIGGAQEDAMSAKAGEVGALLAAGNVAAAQKLMDELSVELAAAMKAKEASDLQKQLDRLKTRLEASGAAGPQLRELNKLAADAQTSIKAQDTAAAKATIKKLGDELDKIAPADAGKVDYAKSSQIWVDALQQITTDIGKLRVALVTAYQAEGIAADVEKAYDTVVSPLFTAFDDSLAIKLAEAGKASDPAVHTQLVGEARTILGRYNAALSNPVIADLDSNPFVPLSLRQTLSTTLTDLSTAIS